MLPLRSRKARSARGCKAASAPCWCKSSKSSRNRSVRSSRWRESSNRSSPPPAPNPRFSTSTTRSRTHAQRANRWPRPLPPSSWKHARSRSIAPAAERLLAAAFTTDIGVERDPLQFEDGYIWYDVAGISPSRERSLDEVKDQVEARWREHEIAARPEPT